MRFYRDRLSSTKSAAGALLFADCLTILAVLMFVTGALSGAGSAIDCWMLAVWSLIPRNLGRFLQWLQKPRSLVVVTSSIFAFLAGLLVALLVGIDLLQKTTYNPTELQRYGPILMLLTWFAGFLLAFPGWYRVHDALIGGVAVLALIEQMPAAGFWIPLFVIGLSLSACTRHLIYDVHGDRPRARINLHNARAVAAGAGVLASVAFLLMSSGLSLVVATPEKVTPRFFLPDGAMDFLPGGAADETDASVAAPAPGQELPSPARARGNQRNIGFSQDVELSDLSTPSHDPRIVLRARLLSGSTFWTPQPHTLWKGAVLTHFNGKSEEWTVDPAPETYAWPSDGLVTISQRNPTRKSVKLEVTVTLPVMQSLVTPYHVNKLGEFARATPDFGYHTNAARDIYPEQGIRQGDAYVTFFQPPVYDGSQFPMVLARQTIGAHPDRATLSVPHSKDIGIDLHSYAGAIFGQEISIGGRVEALHRHFEEHFLYNNEDSWSREKGRLSIFLAERHTGDCVYFATATALILRAGGISTRMATGFIGGHLERGGAFLVLNRDAHTWVEVFIPGAGWYPFDVTQSTPSHPDFTPPDAPPQDPENLPDRVQPQELEDSAQQRADAARASPDSGAAAKPERPELVPTPPVSDPEPLPATEDPRTPLDLGDEADASAGSDDRPQSESGETAALGAVDSDGGPDAVDSPARSASEESTSMRDLFVRLGLILVACVTLYLTTLSFLRPSAAELTAEAPQDEELPQELVATTTPIERDPESADEAIAFEYAGLQRDLLQSRNHRRDHETPVEHGRRFTNRHKLLTDAFDLMTERLYGALYGPDESSDADVSEFRRGSKVVRKHLR